MDFGAEGDEAFLIPEGGAGTDEGHLTGEDVEDLREFVERGLAEEFADLGDVLFGVG